MLGAVWGLEAARQRWLAAQQADLVASPPLVRRPDSLASAEDRR
jgi:hypothetical protein